MQTVEIISGIVIVILVLFDVFMSVIVPRQTSPKMRISPFMTSKIFWPCQLWISRLIRNPEWELLVLETFAPVCFVLMMLIWLFLLICGYALILLAFGSQVTPPI